METVKDRPLMRRFIDISVLDTETVSSENTETEEESQRNLDWLEQYVPESMLIKEDWYKNLDDILDQCQLSSQHNEGQEQLWYLDLDFIDKVIDKHTPKCVCGKCRHYYLPHEQGDYYWYLEQFGCNFTCTLRKYFDHPKRQVFNGDYIQDCPLILKSKEVEQELMDTYEIMSSKTKYEPSEMKKELYNQKTYALQKILHNHLLDLKVSGD